MNILRDMKPAVRTTYLEAGVKKLIKRTFAQPERFQVRSETRIFKPSEQKYILDQKNGVIPEVVEVYFDYKYLCDISEAMRPDEAAAMIQVQLIRAIGKRV